MQRSSGELLPFSSRPGLKAHQLTWFFADVSKGRETQAQLSSEDIKVGQIFLCLWPWFVIFDAWFVYVILNKRCFVWHSLDHLWERTWSMMIHVWYSMRVYNISILMCMYLRKYHVSTGQLYSHLWQDWAQVFSSWQFLFCRCWFCCCHAAGIAPLSATPWLLNLGQCKLIARRGKQVAERCMPSSNWQEEYIRV